MYRSHGPEGLGWATIGKTVFYMCWYWEKISRTSRPNSIKIGTDPPVKEFIMLHIKGQVFLKGEIITKMQK
jgi:hypothetical protein